MSTIEQLSALLIASQSVLILPHIREDGDAAGSSLALAHLLKACGKEAMVLYSEPLVPTLQFLPGGTVYTEGMALPAYDLCIAVDCAAPDRIGSRMPLFENAPHTAVIDHHGTNPGYGEVCWVEGTSAATGLMIYDLYTAMHVAISPEAADALYTAIFTDTGGFRFSSTDARVLRTAASLLDAGAHHTKIYTEVYERVSPQGYLLTARAMSKTKMYFGGSVAIICLTQEDFLAAGEKTENTDNISSLPRTIDGVELSVLLRESKNGEIHASIRTKARINAAAIALSFGGGGHERAAGFTVKEPMDAVEEKLLAIIEACIS